MTKVAMRDAFLSKLAVQMELDEDVFFLTADFGSPVIDHIKMQFPSRFLNVGIAEQNLVNLAAGIGLEGFRVFAYGIAPFVTMRCYEQLRVNLALLSKVRELNVNLIGVGAGYSYVVSGPTHQCYEDLSIMRTLPAFELLSPSDSNLSALAVDLCLNKPGPKYVRLDAQILPTLPTDEIGDARKRGFRNYFEGKELVVITTGYCVHIIHSIVLKLGLEARVSLVDVFNLSSFDHKALLLKISYARNVVTLEEGFVGVGGLDALINELLRKAKHACRIENIGIPREYSFDLGTREQLHEKAGIGEVEMTKFILNSLAQTED